MRNIKTGIFSFNIFTWSKRIWIAKRFRDILLYSENWIILSHSLHHCVPLLHLPLVVMLADFIPTATEQPTRRRQRGSDDDDGENDWWRLYNEEDEDDPLLKRACLITSPHTEKDWLHHQLFVPRIFAHWSIKSRATQLASCSHQQSLIG